jgi:hypothetical protein
MGGRRGGEGLGHGKDIQQVLICDWKFETRAAERGNNQEKSTNS